MPSMANITVKNVANADVVYVAKTPSSGDKTPAVWMLDAASPVIGLRPKFQVQTRNNGAGNGRIFESTFSGPVVQTDAASLPYKAATAVIDVRAVLPTNVDANAVYEWAFQHGNLLVSALIRAVQQDGYAPT